MQSNLAVLMGQSQQRTGKRLSVRALAMATNIQAYTVRRLVHNELKEIPVHAIDQLCKYFDCQVGDLLVRGDQG